MLFVQAASHIVIRNLDLKVINISCLSFKTSKGNVLKEQIVVNKTIQSYIQIQLFFQAHVVVK